MKRNYSLKTTKDIDSVFKGRVSVGNVYFAIYKKQHEYPHFKFALSIGRKYGNAVKRNLAKRRIRFILSENKSRIDNNFSFVIVIKPKAAELKYEDMLSNLNKLLIQSKLMKKEDKINA